MSLEFYDYHGVPVAYTDDEEHIYSFDGRPVAYICGSRVYSYRGRQLGHFDRGLIHDNRGLLVLITPDSRGGTMKPLLRPVPTKNTQRVKPAKKNRRPGSTPLFFLGLCSRITGQQFFPELAISLVHSNEPC